MEAGNRPRGDVATTNLSLDGIKQGGPEEPDGRRFATGGNSEPVYQSYRDRDEEFNRFPAPPPRDRNSFDRVTQSLGSDLHQGKLLGSILTLTSITLEATVLRHPQWPLVPRGRRDAKTLGRSLALLSITTTLGPRMMIVNHLLTSSIVAENLPRPFQDPILLDGQI